MAYALPRYYGLCSPFPRLPTRETGLAIGYGGLWVQTGMGYNGVDCIREEGRTCGSGAETAQICTAETFTGRA